MPFLSTYRNRVRNQTASNFDTVRARNGTFAAARAGDARSAPAANRMINNFDAVNEQRTTDAAAQEHFMKDTVKQGNYALEDINRQSGVLRGRLTDQAVANQNRYYDAGAFIQDSGIEGSRNRGRNLAYMKGRDAARTQLEYELMGAQADSVSRSTASRFDRLFRHGRPASGCLSMAACCFRMVQHPAGGGWHSMAACCFQTVQHLVR
jgi:hypothetical protein